MPILSKSSYQAPFWLKGGHLQTIYPALFPKRIKFPIIPERIELHDGDFLDLEWTGTAADRLAILTHGLEGSTQSPYINAMKESLQAYGWDVLSWNLRGCSEEMNRLPGFYHAGKTEDLSAVIEHSLRVHTATKIDLIGFSLGGNLVLKYLGERGQKLHQRIHRTVSFSVPCDLESSSIQLAKAQNTIYMNHFMKSLRKKIRRKQVLYPDQFDLRGLDQIKTFAQFDEQYTAPLNGFHSAKHYWERNSSVPFLCQIIPPTLLINAKNDPFLGAACYPLEEAQNNHAFYLECPEQGGHIGFGSIKINWAAQRAIDFLLTKL